MRKIHIMSGIPASGKTTFIAAAKDEADVELHRDDYRDVLRSYINTEAYFPVAAEAEWAYWAGVLISNIVLDPDHDIWIDQTTNNINSFRKLYSALAPFIRNTDQIIVHILDTPLDECKRRNALRSGNRRVPDSAIESMHTAFHADTKKLTERNIKALNPKAEVRFYN